MPNITLSVQTLSRQSPPATFTPQSMIPADTYFFSNNGVSFIYVEGGATAETLTIATTRGNDGATAPSRTFAIGINARVMMGPFDPPIYNDSNGQVRVSGTGTNVLKVAAFSLY